MVSDDPAKGVGKAPRGALLAAALRHAIGEPQSETRLVSGYFVPGRAGVDALGALAARGVDVAVFTNAFQSTDVWIVRSEEHTSEIQYLMRFSYAVFCLNKNTYKK